MELQKKLLITFTIIISVLAFIILFNTLQGLSLEKGTPYQGYLVLINANILFLMLLIGFIFHKISKKYVPSYKEKYVDNIPKWNEIDKFGKIIIVFLASGSIIMGSTVLINTYFYAFQVSNIFSRFFLITEYIGTIILIIGAILAIFKKT